MYCENKFCVYNIEGESCTLEEISINAIGNCNSIILVNIPEETLTTEKTKILKRYEETYKRWAIEEN